MATDTKCSQILFVVYPRRANVHHPLFLFPPKPSGWMRALSFLLHLPVEPPVSCAVLEDLVPLRKSILPICWGDGSPQRWQLLCVVPSVTPNEV